MTLKSLSGQVDLTIDSNSSSEDFINEKDVKEPLFQDKSDEQLWKMLKGGNDASLIALYNRFFNLLGSYGYQFTKDNALIEDSIQDLFIDLNVNRKQLPEIKYSVKSYLIKSIKYKILQYLRNDNKKIAAHRESNFFEFDYVFSIEHNIISKQVLEEQKQRLENATGKLTSRQREALYYYYNEQMSFEQIKDIMGLTNIKSVRNLIYKSISRIRSHF